MTMAFAHKRPMHEKEEMSGHGEEHEMHDGAPEEDAGEVAEQHGPAEEVTMKSDSTGHHVSSMHPDGHKHHSSHQDHGSMMHAASQLMGQNEEKTEEEHHDEPMAKAQPPKREGHIPGY